MTFVPATTVWRAQAATGCTATLSHGDGPSGASLRLDCTLAGHGAWAILRTDASCTLPEHYAVVLQLRGTLPPTTLQVKLVDPSGANVWWWRRPAHVFSATSERIVLRKAALAFAWGPASGGDPTRIGAVEVAIAADDGRAGTLWIDALRIEPRALAASALAVRGLRASTHATGHEPSQALAPGIATCWRPTAGDDHPWLELDLGCSREWGGVAVDLASASDTPPLQLLSSDDGVHWLPVASVTCGTARRRWLKTPDAESRFARLEFPAHWRGGVAHVTVVPLDLAVAPARYAARRAHESARGRFPRHLLDEQAYWAVVGADGDERKGLLSEDGALEIDAEAFSLEPFLWTDGRLSTWHDAERTLSLADGHLPVPSVAWRLPPVTLRVTACGIGAAGASTLVARYEVTNTTTATRDVRLYVTIRPYQVNPTWQSLNLVGGIAPIERLEVSDTVVLVNGTRQVIAVTRADGFGAAPSEHGLAGLWTGHPPRDPQVDDPIGFAEAALWFDLRLDPGAAEVVTLAVPLHDATPRPPAGLPRIEAAAWANCALAGATDHWRSRLAPVPITLPPSAASFSDSLRASLAWILVNRAGPRIQPGPRCYRRSWIRDGALTATALAEMGFTDEARDFFRWYAPFQSDDGRVPCAVDRHGVDPVAEHDSHGQFVWGIIDLFRLTGDRGFLDILWPRVLRAVDAIAALRAERTTAAHRHHPTFGLLPESISHEGYSSRPVHAYWDNFFAVRALADATWAAGVLDDQPAATRLRSLRDAMRSDLHASIAAAIRLHGIDFVPGSVELGDFDPTSTAIAFDPCGESTRLPSGPLAATFERYWAEFIARRSGTNSNGAYAPYEVRTATALLRLGWRERALALLSWLIDDQRPTAWRQWPEIAWRDVRAPRFLGDLPHGWVASSFVRAVRRLLVYERDDGALALAAGIPERWVREAPGVGVHGLPTHFGRVDFAMYAPDDQTVVVRIGGAARPPGGFVLTSPLAAPLRDIVVDGRRQPVTDSHEATVTSPVTEVHLHHRS